MAPGAVTPRGAIDKGTTGLVLLFALNRLRVDWPQLACRWRQDDDGRLTCIWEPDIVLLPRR